MAEYYLDLATVVAALQSLGQTGRIETDLSAIPQKGRGNAQPGHLALVIQNGRVASWVVLDINGRQISAGDENDVGTLQKHYPLRMKWQFTQTVLPTSTMSATQFSPVRDSNDARYSNEPPYAFGSSRPRFSSDVSSRRAGVPRRVRVLSAEYLALMPRQYRMIYALVNGSNSVERIIQLMTAVPPDTIEMILHELQARDIIA